jgi:hypothetical protein
VNRKAVTLLAVLLAVSAVTAEAQQSGPASPSIPAAVRSQLECSGFVSGAPLARDWFVAGGADDDFQSLVRQFVQGDSIYVSPRSRGGEIAAGDEYRVVRPARELFRMTHYQGQGRELKRLGIPYSDIAKVKVTHVNSEGAVAKVVSSCEPIVPGDILVPFEPRAIPQYTVTKPLDLFILPDKYKVQGRITASRDNFGNIGREIIIYVDFGEMQGTLPGRRLRIYKLSSPKGTGSKTTQQAPPETVGEAIVLSVETKSCVAIVISSYREISAGDYVELE